MARGVVFLGVDLEKSDWREFLPEKVADAFGMGRDLKAGNDPSPVEILPGVRAGMAIC